MLSAMRILCFVLMVAAVFKGVGEMGVLWEASEKVGWDRNEKKRKKVIQELHLQTTKPADLELIILEIL